MAAHAEPLLRHIHRLVCRPSTDPAGDAALLERFVSQGDESAFAALLARHGPMVLGVCRRVLRDRHEAEDAFQATFLVLARKAGSLRRPQSLAAWLYGTARHLALKCRRRDGRRRQRETASLRGASAPAATDPLDDLAARELLLVLDEEMERLPEVYRLPLILCGLEGRPQEEAARLLGWTPASLRGRLERARRRLHGQLSRRGLAFSGALLALDVSQSGAARATPQLASATLAAALAFARGNRGAATAKALALAEAGMRGIAATKVKMGLVLLLATSLIAGMGALAHQASATKQSSTQPGKRESATASAAAPRAPTVGKLSRTDVYGDPLPPGAIARMGTVRFRQGGTILSVAFSPDGKMLASGGNEYLVRLWDAATGKELRQFQGHGGVVWCVAFSPDGKTLATGGVDQTLRLWDVATAKEKLRLRANNTIIAIAFSPDGKTIAVGSNENMVRLFDVATGHQQHNLPLDQGAFVFSVAFSPDGKMLAAGDSRGGKVYLWEVATGKQLRRFVAHKNSAVRCLAFSPNGEMLASASEQEGVIRLWRSATGEELRSLEGHPHGICSIAFSPDGKTLASGGRDAVVCIWDTATGKVLRKIERHRQHRVESVAFSPDGKVLASADNRTIHLWDIAACREASPVVGLQDWVYSVAFSPDGKTLASASLDHSVRLWKPTTGEELRRFTGHRREVSSVAFSPNGWLLASASSDRTIRLWDTSTGKEVRRLPRRDDSGADVTFSPDGKILAASVKNEIVLWETATGKEIRRIKGGDWGIVFSPDGKTLASGPDLWRVATGEKVRRFPLQQPPYGRVAFSPDGRLLAVGEWDGKANRVRLFDVAADQERRPLVVRPQAPFTMVECLTQCVAFSPDGKTLASAHADGTVRLWEVAASEEQERRRFVGHRGNVFHIAFSPDGRSLASASADQTIVVWEAAGRIAEQERAILLTEKELARLWTELGDEKNAARAYQAMRRLLRDPTGTMRWFREHLHPVPTVEKARVAHWIADLDSTEFAVREQATRELARRGEAVEGALRKLLEGRPSLEVRRRVEMLLEKLNGVDRLRALRAVEVLEYLDTAQSQRLLEALAGGAPDARRTQEAKASLARRTIRP